MASKIPGMSNMMGQGMDDEESAQKLRRMIYICDSMTTKELDGDGKIFVEQPTRMTRVARGSGTSVREVEELLSQHRTMAGMAKKVKGGMANAQRAQGMMGGPNRQQQMAAMQKRMQAMGRGGGAGAGGMGDLMNMMGGMGGGGPGGGGGMPDMSTLMNMMGNMGGMMGGGAGGGRGGRR